MKITTTPTALRSLAAIGILAFAVAAPGRAAFADSDKSNDPKVSIQSSDKDSKDDSETDTSSDDKSKDDSSEDDEETNASTDIKAFEVCTWNSGPGQYVTVFGYKAGGNFTIPIGPFNKFVPGNNDQGQGTKFTKGTNFNAAVVSHTKPITWTLGGSAAHGPTTELCKDNPMPATGHPLSAILWIGVTGLGCGAYFLVQRRRNRQYF